MTQEILNKAISLNNDANYMKIEIKRVQEILDDFHACFGKDHGKTKKCMYEYLIDKVENYFSYRIDSPLEQIYNIITVAIEKELDNHIEMLNNCIIEIEKEIKEL